MKISIPILVLLLCNTAFGQGEKTEINNQVWKVFIESYNTFDVEGFMGVHSKEVIRSPRDGGEIFGYDESYNRTEKSATRNKLHKGTRKIELRFSERITKNNLAYEIGIYKVESIDADGHSKFFYGKFHVVLRKENGEWKILVDSDSSENNTIGEVDFQAAQPIGH
jgi:ketosteroid isomerase-like protein